MENAIIAQNIKRYFKAGDGTTVHALDGVSMEIKKGTLAILKGRSGSGKTTLLNILSALDMPTEGSVQFLDKNLEQMTEKDREMLRRYEMGFVFQSIALIPTMTAYENVEFALRLAKNKRQIRKNLTDMDNDIGDAKNDVINENTHDRVSELLESVGLSKRMDHMPGQLSGGEQQRVAIARAVVHRPKVVFADEPTGAVDTRTADTIYELFQKLNKELGITIIIVTHDMALAGRVDRTVLISDGKVSTEKLKKHPAMEYTVLDKAHRIKLTDEMLEAAGIESNKVRVDVQDGRLVISRI